MKEHSHSHSPQQTPFQHSNVGVYVHIPYCLQKCHYCDFVKFSVDEIPPIEEYFKLLFKELEFILLNEQQKIRTLYFGGGTPSLAPKHLLEKFTKTLMRKVPFTKDLEMTLEINPGTLNLQDLIDLNSIGFNRFCIGIQTFNPRFLKSCGRKHTTQDSLKDLENLQQLGLNFNADLLFGIPQQSLKDLKEDLKTLTQFEPKHVSPYNLTLPSQHFFNKNRASDQVQLEMMKEIEQALLTINCQRYEISNFAVPGFESKHNKGYWEDRPYLGLGMGAHSYLKNSPWGTRTWNTGDFNKYIECLQTPERKHQKKEVLLINEALTDFCHTSLRQLKGLSKKSLLQKFNSSLPKELWAELSDLEAKKLIFYQEDHWKLSFSGLKIPNEVFKRLCFLKEDFKDE